jgi:hypothetical protein
MVQVELCFQEVPCHAWAHFASLVKMRIGNHDMSAQSSESLWESEEKVSIIGDRLYTLFARPFPACNSTVAFRPAYTLCNQQFSFASGWGAVCLLVCI